MANYRKKAVLGVVSGAMALLSPAALAHPGHGDSIGFVAGLMHPLSGVDHMVAMIAVGFWAAQLGRHALLALPLAFPLLMAVGALLGVSGQALPAMELGIALSSIVLGALIFARAQFHALLAAVLVGTLALCHGYAHGVEMPTDTNPVIYGAGFILSTFLLHFSGMALGMLHRFSEHATVVRGVGAGVAGAGAYLLAHAIF